MSSDVLDSVFSCRREVASTICEIIVRRDDDQKRGVPFHAVAQRVERHTTTLIVNERGLPLKAFGRTPQQAADYLESALRRRWRQR